MIGAVQPLNDRIADFYDSSSALWQRAWGEHMHHGYYSDGQSISHQQAQIEMIERLLHFGNVTSADAIVDAGCGIGGSARYISRKFGAAVVGLTLSERQAQAARHYRHPATGYAVADVLAPPLAANRFDLFWSMESGEHMADKRRFLAVAHDLLRPHGTFLMATWCHRRLPPPLSAGEERRLNALYRDYHLPYIVSIEQYAALAREAGFQGIEIEDWTEAVAPFWPAVARSALAPANLLGLLRAGRSTIIGALAIRHMIFGFRSGLIRFGVLRATRSAPT